MPSEERPAPAPTPSAPVWEHGWRVHGYLLDGVRVGWVGKPPGRKVNGQYSWGVLKPGTEASYWEGCEPTLRRAKRAVEKMYSEIRQEAKRG